jgi:hypothetical protein
MELSGCSPGLRNSSYFSGIPTGIGENCVSMFLDTSLMVATTSIHIPPNFILDIYFILSVEHRDSTMKRRFFPRGKEDVFFYPPDINEKDCILAEKFRSNGN